MEKLNEIDFKLLSYLYHNFRSPISEIAKATKLTREQVDYRLSNYFSSGLIKKFFPVFNYKKFSYNYLNNILLKFDKFEYYNKFIKKIENSKNCISYGKAYGKYDLFMNCIFKDEKELNDFVSKLLGDEETPISDYFIINPFFAELYPLKFFKHNEKEDFMIVGSSDSKTKIDEKDKEICKILSNDARTKIVDIADKCKIGAEVALYRLRKLIDEQVILGSRIQFDMAKLGYYFSVILLNIRNISESNREKIKKFARNSKHVNSLVFSLNRPNFIIQLFHKEEYELRQTINEIRELLKDNSFDMDVLLINEDENINALPFVS